MIGLSRDYVPHVVSPVSSSSSTSSDDSDVHVLDEAIDLRVNAELPGVGPHPVNMPGNNKNNYFRNSTINHSSSKH